MNQELDELRSMLGSERVIALLNRFRSELEPAFVLTPDNPAAIRQRAHKTVSQAGMLGFHCLSDAARELEYAACNHAALADAMAVVTRLQSKVLVRIPSLLDELASNPVTEAR